MGTATGCLLVDHKTFTQWKIIIIKKKKKTEHTSTVEILHQQYLPIINHCLNISKTF